MMRFWAIAVAGLGAAVALHGDARSSAARTPMTGNAPAVMLWAWEESEDLRSADVKRVGVAFLAERVFVSREVRQVWRQQRILAAEGTYAVAVVRVETAAGFIDTEQTRAGVSDAILRAARLPGVRGVQVDFDATESQRGFYADVLRKVRTQLPADEDLTMTALVSWCGAEGGWLRGLPVDAAVPMFFRLGMHTGNWGSRAEQCATNVGVSTDEPEKAREMTAGRRVWIFAPRPWTAEQLAVVNRGGFPEDVRGRQ